MRPLALLALLLLSPQAGCASTSDPVVGRDDPVPVFASAELVDRAGVRLGRAEFSRHSQGHLFLRVRASGLTAGEHGMHIHENGVCELPGFTSAGPHLKRQGVASPHGLLHPSGGEAGDLPNLFVEQDGEADQGEYASIQLREVRGGTTSVIGRALVIHAQRDDQRTQPIGGSGDRIACGVIRAER